MGDADNSQIMMSVEEVEALMDNAWNDLDDGLDSLFSFINVLNEHNAYIMSEIASWEKLRRCFMALNVFVIPVMLSIWIAFGTTDVVEQDSSTETVLQMIVFVLMFISGSIGFPLYVFALLRACRVDHKVEEELHSQRVSSEVASDENRRASTAGGSEQSLHFGGDSLEIISEFARQANRRFMDNIRQDLERRVNQAGEEDESGSAGIIETSEMNNDQRTAASEPQLVDLNPDHFAADDPLGTVRPESLLKEETDFYGFKVIILNNTKDLSVEIEKQEEGPKDCKQAHESRLLELGDEYPPSSIRSIAVENVGEGDSNRMTGKDCWTGQVFGL